MVNRTRKKFIALRISDQAHKALLRLVKRLGKTKTRVIEEAILNSANTKTTC